MKQKLKTEVDKAAQKLILEGFSDREITMIKLGEELEITAPTIYHYYPGKKEILKNAYARIIDDIHNAFNLTMPGSMPPELKIKTRLIGLISYIGKNPGIMDMILNNGESIHVEKKKAIKKIAEFKKEFKAMLGEYLTQKKKRISAVQSMYILISITTGQLYYVMHSGKKNHDPQDIVEDIFDLWVNGIK